MDEVCSRRLNKWKLHTKKRTISDRNGFWERSLLNCLMDATKMVMDIVFSHVVSDCFKNSHTVISCLIKPWKTINVESRKLKCVHFYVNSNCAMHPWFIPILIYTRKFIYRLYSPSCFYKASSKNNYDP